MSAIAFATPQALADWLAQHAIDTTGWGQAGSKHLADLWQEVAAGEVTLVDNPPLRVVAVVQVLLVQNEQLLVELAQELGDGRIRHRNNPPSDKMKPGEYPATAASRCLLEEVNLTDAQFQLDLNSIASETRIGQSPSYPGLLTSYQFYTLRATTDALPTTSFWRSNSAFGEGDPVRRHQWGWLPLDETAV